MKGPKGHAPAHGGGKGGHKGGKGKGKGAGGLRYGAFAGYAGVPRRRAARFVNADLRALRRDTHAGVQKENRQFNRQRHNVNKAFRWSGYNLNQIGKQEVKGANDTIRQGRAAQKVLHAALAQSMGATDANANANLDRLGLSGSDSMAMAHADAANAQNVGAADSANFENNMRFMRESNRGLMQQMKAMNIGEHQSQVGNIRDLRNENVSELRNAYYQAQAGRGDSIRTLLDQMAQTGWAQHMDQAGLNLARQNVKKNGSMYTGFSGSRFSGGYSPRSYSSNYGYGNSSSTGYSPNSSGYGSGSANATKTNLYGNMLGVTP